MDQTSLLTRLLDEDNGGSDSAEVSLRGKEEDAGGAVHEQTPPPSHSSGSGPISPTMYLFCACAAFNSCILGYDFGVNVLSALLVKNTLNLSDLQIAAFLGALNGFSMLGAATTSFISDRFGRRGCFMVTSVAFFCGDLLQASAQNYAQLMTGRSILGVAIGWGLAIDPMYISEIAPAGRRGFLVSWSEIAINVGITLGLSSGLVFCQAPDQYAWRYMYATGAVLPIFMLILVKFFMPESPRWLLQKGRDDAAHKVLATLYPENEHEVEALGYEIKRSIQKEEEAFHPGWNFLLCHPRPAYKSMLTAGVLAGIAQQVVGIDAIGPYQTFILNDSGVTDRYNQALILLGCEVLKCIITFGSSRVTDTWGRRPLAFISITGIVVSLFLLAIDFHLSSGATSALSIVGIFCYMGSFAAGMGPISWLVPSEVFTTPIRAKGTSITTFLNRGVSAIMAFSFLALQKAVSMSGVFLILICLSIVMAALIYHFVPETMGESLEDMAIYFATLTGDKSVLEYLESEHSTEESSHPNATKNAASTRKITHEII